MRDMSLALMPENIGRAETGCSSLATLAGSATSAPKAILHGVSTFA